MYSSYDSRFHQVEHKESLNTTDSHEELQGFDAENCHEHIIVAA